jgi:hypothetical protein
MSGIENGAAKVRPTGDASNGIGAKSEGVGVEVCPTCKGAKTVECTCCEDYPCAYCEGSGTIPPHEVYKSKVCDQCKGHGHICKKCGNTGVIECEHCWGDGVV